MTVHSCEALLRSQVKGSTEAAREMRFMCAPLPFPHIPVRGRAVCGSLFPHEPVAESDPEHRGTQELTHAAASV